MLGANVLVSISTAVVPGHVVGNDHNQVGSLGSVRCVCQGCQGGCQKERMGFHGGLPKCLTLM